MDGSTGVSLEPTITVSTADSRVASYLFEIDLEGQLGEPTANYQVVAGSDDPILWVGNLRGLRCRFSLAPWRPDPLVSLV